MTASPTMSQESYNLLLPEIQALPDSQTLKPKMPVATIIQEASDLLVWCQEDWEQLTATGLPQNLHEQLALQLEALIYSQSQWNHLQMDPGDEVNAFRQKRTEAQTLREDLIHGLRFAYRHQSELLSTIKSSRGRMNTPALIQDLHDLSILGLSHYQSEMEGILPKSKLEEAANLSASLSQLAARANLQKSTKSVLLLIRNKAYTLLKHTVTEIRRTGKYVFRKTPNRRKGYESTYWSQRNK